MGIFPYQIKLKILSSIQSQMALLMQVPDVSVPEGPLLQAKTDDRRDLSETKQKQVLEDLNAVTYCTTTYFDIESKEMRQGNPLYFNAQSLLCLLNEKLGENLVEIDLSGSSAYGNKDKNSSDVDLQLICRNTSIEQYSHLIEEIFIEHGFAIPEYGQFNPITNNEGATCGFHVRLGNIDITYISEDKRAVARPCIGLQDAIYIPITEYMSVAGQTVFGETYVQPIVSYENMSLIKEQRLHFGTFKEYDVFINQLKLFVTKDPEKVQFPLLSFTRFSTKFSNRWSDQPVLPYIFMARFAERTMSGEKFSRKLDELFTHFPTDSSFPLELNLRNCEWQLGCLINLYLMVNATNALSLEQKAAVDVTLSLKVFMIFRNFLLYKNQTILSPGSILGGKGCRFVPAGKAKARDIRYSKMLQRSDMYYWNVQPIFQDFSYYAEALNIDITSEAETQFKIGNHMEGIIIMLNTIPGLLSHSRLQMEMRLSTSEKILSSFDAFSVAVQPERALSLPEHSLLGANYKSLVQLIYIEESLSYYSVKNMQLIQDAEAMDVELPTTNANALDRMLGVTFEYWQKQKVTSEPKKSEKTIKEKACSEFYLILSKKIINLITQNADQSFGQIWLKHLPEILGMIDDSSGRQSVLDESFAAIVKTREISQGVTCVDLIVEESKPNLLEIIKLFNLTSDFHTSEDKNVFVRRIWNLIIIAEADELTAFFEDEVLVAFFQESLRPLTIRCLEENIAPVDDIDVFVSALISISSNTSIDDYLKLVHKNFQNKLTAPFVKLVFDRVCNDFAKEALPKPRDSKRVIALVEQRLSPFISGESVPPLLSDFLSDYAKVLMSSQEARYETFRQYISYQQTSVIVDLFRFFSLFTSTLSDRPSYREMCSSAVSVDALEQNIIDVLAAYVAKNSDQESSIQDFIGSFPEALTSFYIERQRKLEECVTPLLTNLIIALQGISPSLAHLLLSQSLEMNLLTKEAIVRVYESQMDFVERHPEDNEELLQSATLCLSAIDISLREELVLKSFEGSDSSTKAIFCYRLCKNQDLITAQRPHVLTACLQVLNSLVQNESESIYQWALQEFAELRLCTGSEREEDLDIQKTLVGNVILKLLSINSIGAVFEILDVWKGYLSQDILRDIYTKLAKIKAEREDVSTIYLGLVADVELSFKQDCSLPSIARVCVTKWMQLLEFEARYQLSRPVASTFKQSFIQAFELKEFRDELVAVVPQEKRICKVMSEIDDPQNETLSVFCAQELVSLPIRTARQILKEISCSRFILKLFQTLSGMNPKSVKSYFIFLGCMVLENNEKRLRQEDLFFTWRQMLEVDTELNSQELRKSTESNFDKLTACALVDISDLQFWSNKTSEFIRKRKLRPAQLNLPRLCCELLSRVQTMPDLMAALHYLMKTIRVSKCISNSRSGNISLVIDYLCLLVDSEKERIPDFLETIDWFLGIFRPEPYLLSEVEAIDKKIKDIAAVLIPLSFETGKLYELLRLVDSVISYKTKNDIGGLYFINMQNFKTRTDFSLINKIIADWTFAHLTYLADEKASEFRFSEESPTQELIDFLQICTFAKFFLEKLEKIEPAVQLQVMQRKKGSRSRGGSKSLRLGQAKVQESWKTLDSKADATLRKFMLSHPANINDLLKFLIRPDFYALFFTSLHIAQQFQEFVTDELVVAIQEGTRELTSRHLKEADGKAILYISSFFTQFPNSLMLGHIYVKPLLMLQTIHQIDCEISRLCLPVNYAEKAKMGVLAGISYALLKQDIDFVCNKNSREIQTSMAKIAAKHLTLGQLVCREHKLFLSPQLMMLYPQLCQFSSQVASLSESFRLPFMQLAVVEGMVDAYEAFNFAESLSLNGVMTEVYKIITDGTLKDPIIISELFRRIFSVVINTYRGSTDFLYFNRDRIIKEDNSSDFLIENRLKVILDPESGKVEEEHESLETSIIDCFSFVVQLPRQFFTSEFEQMLEQQLVQVNETIFKDNMPIFFEKLIKGFVPRTSLQMAETTLDEKVQSMVTLLRIAYRAGLISDEFLFSQIIYLIQNMEFSENVASMALIFQILNEICGSNARLMFQADTLLTDSMIRIEEAGFQKIRETEVNKETLVSLRKWVDLVISVNSLKNRIGPRVTPDYYSLIDQLFRLILEKKNMLLLACFLEQMKKEYVKYPPLQTEIKACLSIVIEEAITPAIETNSSMKLALAFIKRLFPEIILSL
jgi:hypothetical protein